MNRTNGVPFWMWLIVAVVISGYTAIGYTAVSGEWVSKWEEDLRYAQAQAIEQHPDLFHKMSREEWDGAFDGLITRLPTLDHYEVAVELACIVARVGDGHTRLTLPLGAGIEFMQGHSKTPEPNVDGLLFHQFPVRFFIDDSGVYIRQIDRGHARARGRRVVGIGTLSTADAIEAVSPTVRHDNDMQLLHHLPMHLVLAEILCARGVIADAARMPIEVAIEGGTETFVLDMVAHGQTVDWVDARSSAPQPLHMQGTDKNFWLTRLKNSAVLYVQFNEVYDEEDESIAEFAGRLADTIAGDDIEALIVDLRNNRGGNGSLSRPLLHAILCSKLNEPGRLFTLVGRTTFSAAMMFALELERHTETLFVGEPTGSTPNHYGDSRKIKLPNTGLTLRVSTRYWQNDFTDNRPFIPPHVDAPVTMDDYVEGRDPGVDAVLGIVAGQHDAGRPVAGRWEGRGSIGLNTPALVIEIDDAGGGWMRLPEWEFEAPLQGLESGKGTVTFEVEGPWNRLRFDAGFGDGWMAGTLGTRSRRFPFVVQRME